MTVEQTAGLHRLRIGGVSAAVSVRAASLRSLEVDGVQLVEPTVSFARPPGMSGAVLAPWPNRVEGARWRRDGRELRLTVTEPELGHANHGLLADCDFEPVSSDDAGLVLRAAIEEPPGYPFRLLVVVGYRLTSTGIEVTVSVRNVGTGIAPFAVGAHPYLRVGDTPVERLRVHIDADAAYELDHTHIPRRRFDVTGTGWELRAGSPVPDAPRHATFEHTGAARELIHALAADDGRLVELRADPAFRFSQLYIANDMDTDEGPRSVVAIEPMTAPPNALRSGTGVRELAAGDTWAGGYGIRLRQPLSRTR